MSERAEHHLAGCRVTVDLGVLAANYRTLQRLCAPAQVAGVVKADGYGLGADAIARTLSGEGCKRFFVALPQEGVALRTTLPDAEIIVLNGLFGRGSVRQYLEHALIPTINSIKELLLWVDETGVAVGQCVLNVDTGMNRLGLTVDEALEISTTNDWQEVFEPILVMSHLACTDQPDAPMNRQQFDIFQPVRRAFPTSKQVFCNSAGLALGPEYLGDWTRPGIALFGVHSGLSTPTLPVVSFEARVAQLRRAKAGQTVSYGATVTLARDTLIAVAAMGYADGLPRALSGSGVPLRSTGCAGGVGFIAGKRVPILGRVTMDLTMFDVTDVGEDHVREGDWIELFGPNIGLEEAAMAAGTVPYELLTGLGRRAERRYIWGER